MSDASKIEEFEKADIEVKTVRVEQDGRIIQSISFPRLNLMIFTLKVGSLVS